MYDSYSTLADQLREISKKTSLQAVVYNENENFQSASVLENFNYPYAKRKQVKDEYFAEIFAGGMSKKVDTHKLYFRNSVVCLQDSWMDIFGFTKDVKQFILLKLGLMKPDPNEINYQCDEPFVKLQM